MVVTKSTVPVGTNRKVKLAVQEELDKRGVEVVFDVASNPEFLKEGNACQDFMHPDRVVIGSENAKSIEVMQELYEPFIRSSEFFVTMDIKSAELTKYAANAMLATKISFINEIANISERVGADINKVRRGIASDSRIGYSFLNPGCGYGGSCFPKDVKALIKTAEQYGYPMQVLRAVEDVNERQKSIMFQKLYNYYGGALKGKTIAIWGLAFKAETDDMREATSLVTIQKLLEAGCLVRVYDPVAMDECRRRIGDKVEYAVDMYGATLNADALLVITEWKQFRLPSWGVIHKSMNHPLVIDGRNVYDAQELKNLGFEYSCIGK